jgi:hypothetical protein
VVIFQAPMASQPPIQPTMTAVTAQAGMGGITRPTPPVGPIWAPPASADGNVATFNGATWSGTSNVDPVTTAGTGLTGASCADAADCVLVDWEGNALAGTGA